VVEPTSGIQDASFLRVAAAFMQILQVKTMTASSRLLAFVVICSGILAGCSSMVTSQPQPSAPQSSSVSEVLYVQNDLDPQLFGFRINESDGSLTPVSGSPFAIPVNIRRLGATADGRFVLAARFEGFPGDPIGTYAVPIHPDGSLSPSSALPGLSGVVSTLSVASNLIFSEEAPGDITQRTLDPATGSFSAPTNVTPCFPSVAEFQCGWLSGPSPDGDMLWLRGTNCDPTECSDSLTAVPLQDGNVAFPAVNRFAFAGSFSEPVVLNSGVVSVAFDGFDSNSVVSLYSPVGQLVSSCGMADSPGCTQGWSVASDPRRKFLFIGTLDGKLSTVPLTGAAFSANQVRVWLATAVRPDNMVVNSTGKFLYILDNLSNTVTGYSIGVDGSLAVIPAARFDVSGPNAASGGRVDRAAIIVKLPTE
jgi:hypothetical protein